MQVLKQAKHQKNLFIVTVLLTVLFVINILIKWKMFGQYTNAAQESWLSGVSSVFVQNWLHDGILNLKFGMIRTFDSIEMRDFGDREVYSSFLPGCLILPYLVAKIFSLKAGLVYFQIWACVYHFTGSVSVALITYLLSKKLYLTDNKAFAFALSSGFFYIFGFATFMQLSFGYYTDTSVYLIFIIFLLTEFLDSSNKRLFWKAIILAIGISYEWFFISITVVSLITELNRKENKAHSSWVLLSHLGPLFLMLGLYFYQLAILDKLEHTYLRLLRRTALNSVSDSSFKKSFAVIWEVFCRRHGLVMIIAELVAFWNMFESKFFKNNEFFRNLFILTFAASFLQVFIAFEHSAQHYFAGMKLFIPLIIFLPFVFEELSKVISKNHVNKILCFFLISIFVGNLYMLKWVVSRWKPEHKIYSQIQTVFKDYSYEDIFFSYNLQILMDIYPKEDIKIYTGVDLKPSDRSEGEPFTHLLSRKQVYYINTPEDILLLVNNRELIDKAKVHLVFFDAICDNVLKKHESRIKHIQDFYIIDLSKADLLHNDFVSDFSCKKPMSSRAYFTG